MQRSFQAVLSACFVALSVAACSSSSTSTTPTPTPQTLYFVADATSNAVTAFPLTANGNVSPTQNIVGAATGLGYPRRVVSDATGNLYVANAPMGVAHSITVYSPTATGNVAPLRTITGAATGLTGVNGLAIDGGGNLFAANCGSCFHSTGLNEILIFAPGTNGNVAPTNSIAGANTTLTGPTALTFDASGNLLVSDGSVSNAVLTFAPGATGNVAPIRTIAGAATGIQDAECVRNDSAGLIYVCSNNNSTIAVFAAGAMGNVAPIRTLSGAATGLTNPTSVSFDTTGNMYVANPGSNSITVYAPGATGNQASMFTVSGANTGLAVPIGLAIQF